jgi:hypothetical protein
MLLVSSEEEEEEGLRVLKRRKEGGPVGRGLGLRREKEEEK